MLVDRWCTVYSAVVYFFLSASVRIDNSIVLSVLIHVYASCFKNMAKIKAP
jgi:hypothetical protein